MNTSKQLFVIHSKNISNNLDVYLYKDKLRVVILISIQFYIISSIRGLKNCKRKQQTCQQISVCCQMSTTKQTELLVSWSVL